MKQVTILVPDGVSEDDIFYKCKEIVACDIRFVRPFIVAERHGVKKSEFDEEVKALTGAKYISPAPPSRKEFEALRSRVEKLERKSERQCARAIKMEEGISDDLK